MSKTTESDTPTMKLGDSADMSALARMLRRFLSPAQMRVLRRSYFRDGGKVNISGAGEYATVRAMRKRGAVTGRVGARGEAFYLTDTGREWAAALGDTE